MKQYKTKSFLIKLVLSLFIIFLSGNVFAHTDRNILQVNISSNNELLVEGYLINITSLKESVKKFVTNYDGDPLLAEVKEIEIKYIGATLVSKAVVSIQCHTNTTYDFYLQVQNEIEKAFNELRDEFANKIFGKPYNSLDIKYQMAINKKIPKRISEAEPIKYN